MIPLLPFPLGDAGCTRIRADALQGGLESALSSQGAADSLRHFVTVNTLFGAHLPIDHKDYCLDTSVEKMVDQSMCSSVRAGVCVYTRVFVCIEPRGFLGEL